MGDLVCASRAQLRQSEAEKRMYYISDGFLSISIDELVLPSCFFCVTSGHFLTGHNRKIIVKKSEKSIAESVTVVASFVSACTFFCICGWGRESHK